MNRYSEFSEYDEGHEDGFVVGLAEGETNILNEYLHEFRSYADGWGDDRDVSPQNVVRRWNEMAMKLRKNNS